MNRVFDAYDQEAFAVLSGDRNPMHMDALNARRTQAGAPVVHGVHLLLWALERLAVDGVKLDRLAEIKARFVSFVYLDQEVTLDAKVDDAQMRLRLLVDGAAVVTATLGTAGPWLTHFFYQAKPPVPVGKPREPVFEAMAEENGRLDVPEGATKQARRMFPKLCKTIGATAVCEIALQSTVIGMRIPGLHSIFADMTMAIRSPSRDVGVSYQGKQADSRFRSVVVSTEGASLSATLTAFARFPPSSPPSMKKVIGVIAPQEFAGRRALIIGGSRGIGAVTAKLIAAGGGSVTITYAQGLEEAEAVRDDIAKHGGACEVLQYRTGLDELELEAFTHGYYFATPRIFGKAKVYDQERLRTFLAFYVDGFRDFATTLLAKQPTLNLLYPSSVAVVERPKGMTEYSMAKAAGEILCAEMIREHKGLNITMPRLPRIATDQTATIPPAPAADPLDVMLPILRGERS